MKKIWTIGALIVVLFLTWWGITVYPDWLWFEKLHFSSVFWTMLLSKLGIGLGIWLLLVVVISLNLYTAGRSKRRFRQIPGNESKPDYLAQLGLSGKSADLLLLMLALIISLSIAVKGSLRWDMVLRFFHQQPFGSSDPIFNNDIGFYVFSLPFYVFVQKGLLAIFVFSAIVTVIWYLKSSAIQATRINEFIQSGGKQVAIPKIDIEPSAIRHLIFLGGILVLLLAWGYRLQMFGLLYSTKGAAFGAGYTDVHVRIVSYWVLIVLSLVFAGVLFMNAHRTRTKLIWFSGGIWLIMILLLTSVLPAVVQKVVVKPNELTKESPYIDYNIKNTRKAYNLNKIQEVGFPVADTLTLQDISSHKDTIQNIRIWDERPLLQTYNQLQSIRLYYDFIDVDVDRYHIKKSYRQVMLSARELSVNKLPPQAKTWVNRHLIYTHGYGLAESLVNKVTREGLPDLIIKDLPPIIEYELKIDHPEIYYGEMTDEYVLVKTKTKEFDYPKGDKNVYSDYQGTGGVSINSFVKRLLFSIEFLDPQILFTTYLKPDSRIMYNRRIDRRARVIAPFLDFDADPYLVVSGGRIYWIQDAYTTSDMYPYSSRSIVYGNKRLNYIRNSVKISIDAYNGDVTFYMMDEKDPLVRTYSSMFPRLFKPFNKMPEDLKKHIRYPKDLLKIQSDIYRTYHMKDVQVFYNQEDLWQIPDEIYASSRQKMEPYYIIIRLPEEEEEEYILMLPFTPSKKDNMIAWLAARCDMPDYGNLIVYKLPKEKLVFGPMQIEARIDQQTQISKEMTLWGQRGSNVIRGNLLAIPIQDTFIYVEPIYLEAKPSESQPAPLAVQQGRETARSRTRETGVSSGVISPGSAALPELKRVIVSFGNRVTMEENLERALFSVLGQEVPAGEPAIQASVRVPERAASATSALEHFNKAREFLRKEDWSAYGKELKILENMLNEMAAKTPKKSKTP